MSNITSSKTSSALYGIALICFVMPFVVVSCQSQKVLTLTGVQLVTGTTMEQPGSGPKVMRGDLLAKITLLATVGGLVICLIGTGRLYTILSIVAGTIGGISLLGLKIRIDDRF